MPTRSWAAQARTDPYARCDTDVGKCVCLEDVGHGHSWISGGIAGGQGLRDRWQGLRGGVFGRYWVRNES